VNSAIEKMTRTLDLLLTVLLFGMFLMIAILVVLRYAFGTTIIGGNEATIVAFIYTTAIGASIAISRDEHIAITYFTDKLSPDTQRLLSRVRLVLLTILNVTIAILAVSWIQRTGIFLMPTLGMPQLVAQVSVPLGCLLSALYCIGRLVR